MIVLSEDGLTVLASPSVGLGLAALVAELRGRHHLETNCDHTVRVVVALDALVAAGAGGYRRGAALLAEVSSELRRLLKPIGDDVAVVSPLT